MDFLKAWRVKHAEMLTLGGLGDVPDGAPTPKFCSGVFFSPHFVNESLPFLQQTFQTDACHMGFGKYILQIIYGTSANCNSFPIAFGITFGNETKESWTDFLSQVKLWHEGINIPQRTFITDQAKGLTESIKDVFDESGQLLCGFHRRQNILKNVRGGSGNNSCVWVYNKCLSATNMAQLDRIRNDYVNILPTKAFRYLFNINDNEQFPCARVGDRTDTYLMKRTTSATVEGMNNVFKPARDKTAVDPVNSSLLIIAMMMDQFKRNQELAWKCKTHLTPHGTKLRDEIFLDVDYTKYNISVSTRNDRVNVKIAYIGKIERQCYFLTEDVMGSFFGGCNCGAPYVHGIPCHHMIAVVKSSKVEGLTPTNAMPCWWTTKMWQKQYPKKLSYSNISMNTLKSNHQPNASLRYCPPYAAPSKAGRPKGSNKRGISPMEGKKKKVRVSTEQQMINDTKKKAKGKKGKNAKG
jgi:hypothetical protein